jgi:uncharacterized membrane protein YhaH (DUF805 family)
MQAVNALKSAMQNYVNFSGRAGRGDYWWYMLAYVVVTIVLGFVDGLLFGSGSAQMQAQDGVSFSYNAGILAGLWMLGNLIPMVSCGVRRLHDGDRSGWWYLIGFIPLANFYLLYLLIIKGTAGDNRFGPDPVAADRL